MASRRRSRRTTTRVRAWRSAVNALAEGDRVRFQFGIDPVAGEVQDDRGPIGVGGRHLYLVAFRFGVHADELSEVELPAVKLQPLCDAVSAE